MNGFHGFFLKNIFLYQLQAYERRFPTSPLIPVFVGSEITSDATTADGSVRTTERKCKLVVEAPYLLKKV